MRYPKFLSEELLLITPAGYNRIAQEFEHAKTRSLRTASPTISDDQAAREGKDYWSGQPIDLPQMEVVDGIARIPIMGPIGRGLDDYDKGYGATDVGDVEDDLDDAEDDETVRAILLDIDSPGGMVAGTPELADRITAVNKPIYAFSGGLICSAAYWLASACDGIFATRSADIGCIGVYSAFYDYSEMAKQMGIKVQVFSSGLYKGMGTRGTALSEKQAAFLQGRIMEIAGMFYDQVRNSRGDVADEDMQGQWFKGAAAADKGLIDQMVVDDEEVMELL